jgi:hypothetical protein
MKTKAFKITEKKTHLMDLLFKDWYKQILTILEHFQIDYNLRIQNKMFNDENESRYNLYNLGGRGNLIKRAIKGRNKKYRIHYIKINCGI